MEHVKRPGKKLAALNYAAQAEVWLRRFAGGPAVAEWLADQIKDAIHFTMPDGGCLFDDDLKGIRGGVVRLPYPRVTLEFADDGKHLVLAIEMSATEAHEFGRWLGEARAYSGAAQEHWERYLAIIESRVGDSIFVYALHASASASEWTHPDVGWFMPRSGWGDYDGSELTIAGEPILLLGGHWKDRDDIEAAREAILAPGARAVLELVEALTCSNVRVETVQSVLPAVNVRRVRDGKLPLYETKVLTIDIGEAKQSGSGAERGGMHASPRQHLRRGHIRELANGKRIWIQAMTVGGKGFIRKGYRIRAIHAS